MDKPLLNDPDVYPTDAILDAVLGECTEAYQNFAGKLPEHQIELEWRYYNDGKSWLAKATAKKKTVFWLSVWKGFFRTTFYFTEKTCIGIKELPVSDEIKTRVANQPAMGKLIPVFLDISDRAQLDDAFSLISYKQSCK